MMSGFRLHLGNRCCSTLITFALSELLVMSATADIVKVKVKSLSRVRLFATPRTVAYQAPLSTGILQARVLKWLPLYIVDKPPFFFFYKYLLFSCSM